MSQVTLRLLRFTYKKLKENLTVSDSKELFHKQFPYVIPSLYKRVVDEMLVELNLLNQQNSFFQENYFCVGLSESFNELVDGYEPKEQIQLLFNALCSSTKFDPQVIRETSAKTLKDHKEKSLQESIKLIQAQIKSEIHYSRILVLGIYKVISLASESLDKKDEGDIKLFTEAIGKLNLSETRAEKDISLYRSSLKRFEQAKALLNETISSERKKRKVK